MKLASTKGKVLVLALVLVTVFFRAMPLFDKVYGEYQDSKVKPGNEIVHFCTWHNRENKPEERAPFFILKNERDEVLEESKEVDKLKILLQYRDYIYYMLVKSCRQLGAEDFIGTEFSDEILENLHVNNIDNLLPHTSFLGRSEQSKVVSIDDVTRFYSKAKRFLEMFLVQIQGLDKDEEKSWFASLISIFNPWEKMSSNPVEKIIKKKKSIANKVNNLLNELNNHVVDLDEVLKLNEVETYLLKKDSLVKDLAGLTPLKFESTAGLEALGAQLTVATQEALNDIRQMTRISWQQRLAIGGAATLAGLIGVAAGRYFLSRPKEVVDLGNDGAVVDSTSN